jgi:hypothetical protein
VKKAVMASPRLKKKATAKLSLMIMAQLRQPAAIMRRLLAVNMAKLAQLLAAILPMSARRLHALATIPATMQCRS